MCCLFFTLRLCPSEHGKRTLYQGKWRQNFAWQKACLAWVWDLCQIHESATLIDSSWVATVILLMVFLAVTKWVQMHYHQHLDWCWANPDLGLYNIEYRSGIPRQIVIIWRCVGMDPAAILGRVGGIMPIKGRVGWVWPRKAVESLIKWCWVYVVTYKCKWKYFKKSCGFYTNVKCKWGQNQHLYYQIYFDKGTAPSTQHNHYKTPKR